VSALVRSATVLLLAAALMVVTAAPTHAWWGGRVVVTGPYWGAPYPYPYPYWGYPYGPYYSWQDEQENKAMAGVFLTTEPAMVSGCNQIGLSGDDNVKDLRRKIVRAGGNAAVLTFRVDDLKMMAAEVYKCPTAAAKSGGNTPKGQSPPPPPPPPARSQSQSEPPPPPAGTPPPPPPGARWRARESVRRLARALLVRRQVERFLQGRRARHAFALIRALLAADGVQCDGQRHHVAQHCQYHHSHSAAAAV
jgi:hypothetical protein